MASPWNKPAATQETNATAEENAQIDKMLGAEAPQANSKLAAMFGNKAKAAPTPAPAAASSLAASLSLDSLGDTEEGDEPERTTFSQFSDETPATKPIRDLPPELEKTQRQFVEMMDGVYELLDDPELLGGIIRNIMIELKSNPQYAKLIADEDIRTWLRSMRENMGLARIKKQEAKTKRGTGGTKKVTKVNELADIADDLGIDFASFNS